MMAQSQEKKDDVGKDRFRIWCGLDVSKETFEAALVVGEARSLIGEQEVDMRQIPVRSFARSEAGARKFLAWADKKLAALVKQTQEPRRFGVVMEATGKYSLELTAWLCELRPSLAAAIINPAQASAFIKSLGLRNKTDKVDARALALYGRERNPRVYEPPSAELVQLQALSRQRDALLKTLVAERQRAQEGTPSKVVSQVQRSLIRHLERQIGKIERAMEELIDESADLARDVELIDTIPGVGRQTAMVVLAELGDVRRFSRSRQLSAFVGVSPRVWESGSSVRKRTRLCKAGNARVRSALYMATLTVIGRRNHLGALYQHLVERGKAKRAAMGAVMRKMLVLMRALLRSGECYHDDYHALGRHTRECVRMM